MYYITGRVDNKRRTVRHIPGHKTQRSYCGAQHVTVLIMHEQGPQVATVRKDRIKRVRVGK